jgi:dipeptidase D
MSVRNLEPTALWNFFADLNAVPRPSKREERIVQFMLDFSKQYGLETHVDAVTNVVIKKPATPGMEQRETVILQAHLDMVHQKNEETIFDFDTQGIAMNVEGDWVKADGTTLGSDNGIGVAAIMAILASKEVAHPAIEALFTIDEETGMTGAKQLDSRFLTGRILLNLDTEDDDELSVGCAGGLDTNTSYAYNTKVTNADSEAFQIEIKGLQGGHSGMDIHKGFGNANKLLVRCLYSFQQHLGAELATFDGGGLRNAIPREAKAVFSVKKGDIEALNKLFLEIKEELFHEYQAIEPNLELRLTGCKVPETVLVPLDSKKIINALYGLPNGVYRMSPDIEGLVEASSSLARVLISEGSFVTQSLQRSSVESTKLDVANAIRCTFENIGCEVIQGGEYPGWKPNMQSPILALMRRIYVDLFNESPQVKACHAGLECGILGKHLPDTDMISFGPNIRGAHSPDEKVQISSVQKFWRYFTETLLHIPNKA